MKVSLAAQVLSHSVAAALECFVAQGQLQSKAIGTAEFCHKFNDIFDTVNCSLNGGAQPLKKLMKEKSQHEEEMKSFLRWLDDLTFVDRKNQQDISKRIKCVKGWKITVKAILLLWAKLKSDYSIKSLRTRWLNQDCLENFFSAIRRSNGNNRNPTPQQFSRTFKKLSFNKLMANSETKSTNCMRDDNSLLLSSMIKICENETLEARAQTHESAEMFLPPVSQDKYEMDLGEKNAFRYTCGFILKQSFMKHICDNCKYLAKECVDLGPENLLLYFRQFENCKLMSLHNDFVEYVSSLERLFVSLFPSICHRTGVGKALYEKMAKETPPQNCMEKDFMVKYIIRLRIYYTLKFFNKCREKGQIKEQKFFDVPCIKELMHM